MPLREWQQDANGTWSLDCRSEIHDLRMKVDALYRAEHVDKVEKYKDVPWALRTRNRPLVAAAVLAIAYGIGMAALGALTEPTTGNSTEIRK